MIEVIFSCLMLLFSKLSTMNVDYFYHTEKSHIVEKISKENQSKKTWDNLMEKILLLKLYDTYLRSIGYSF